MSENTQAMLRCQRKRRYANHREASREAANRERWEGGTLIPYRCPVCRHWHLTSQGLGSAFAEMRREDARLQRIRMEATG